MTFRTRPTVTVVYLKSQQDRYHTEQECLARVECQPPETPPPKEKLNPLGLARTWLGKRLVEKPTGYWLDGVPANLTTIMRAYNRMLAAHGAEQIGPEGWRI